MRLPRAAVLALAIGIVSRSADGATLLYALGDPDAGVLGGQSRRLTAQDGVFSAVPFEGGVYVTVDAAHPWGIVFAPPVGQTLAPGAYEEAEFIATADRPALRAVAEGAGCGDLGGRFVVLDLVKGPGDTIVSFAADFEQRCASATGTLRGSIRYHVGDAGCVAAVDGTPCDDLDACTATATCVGGACVPGEGPSCGPASAPCHVPPLCDPTTGACGVSAFAPPSTPCDDGNACTTGESCVAGACTFDSATTTSCYDQDDCTYDVCDPQRGCLYVPIAGTCGNIGRPSSSLFMNYVNPAFASSENRIRVGPPDGSLLLSREQDDISVFGFATGELRYIRLRAGSGGPLVPGRYPFPAHDFTVEVPRPGLAVTGGPEVCYGAGSFDVLEAVYGPTGEVMSFAADFEQQCGASQRIAGAIRFRAGDPGCRAAADGTACDDRDACTPVSQCRGGACVGLGASPCEGSDECQAAPRCDTRDGSCSEFLPNNFVAHPCRDAAACVPAGTCSEGICVSNPLGACVDASVCTVDTCGLEESCSHVVAPGSCWTINGRTTFTATALGKTCRCTQRSTNALSLRDDGTFTMPGGVASCRVGPVAVPEEVGTWAPGPRGSIVLTTTNVDELTAAGSACAGATIRVKRYRTEVTSRDGGKQLRGTHRHVERAKGVKLTLGVRTRFTATPGDGVPPAGATGRSCAQQIARCLND